MIEPYRFPDDGPLRFRRERDLGDVINASVRFCRGTWREWLPALVLIAGPLYVIGGALGSEGVGGQTLGGFVNGAAGLLVSAGSFGYVRLYRGGAERVETADVWEETKGLFWPTLGFAFGCAGVLLVLLVPVLLLAAAAGGVGGVAAAGVVGVVGALAFVALLFVLYPYYLAGFAARLLDEDSFGDAVRRVHRLIREERGFAVGTAVVLLFITAFASFVVGGTVSALAFSAGGADGSIPLWAGVLTGLASVAVLPFAVFSNVAAAFLYESLGARVDGTEVGEGIEAIARAAGLGGAEAAPEPPRPAPAPGETDGPADDGPGGAGGFRGGGFRGAG